MSADDGDSTSGFLGDDSDSSSESSPSIQMYPQPPNVAPVVQLTKTAAFKSLEKCDFHQFGDEETFVEKVKANDPLAKKYVSEMYRTPHSKVKWDKFADTTKTNQTINKVAFSNFGFVDATGSKIELSESSDVPQKKEFLKAYHSQIFDSALPIVTDPTQVMRIRPGVLTPEQQRINQRFQTPSFSDTHI